VIGPKGFGSCQLRIGRGCENDSDAHQLCKLQCKEGNASGALHKYRVTWPDTSEPDYCAPSRHASAWQDSGFRVAQAVRDRQQAALIEDAVLAQDPVQVGAKAGSELLGRRLSFEPALEEDRNDPIPWSKILDPAANGFDYPCPIGNRNHWKAELRIVGALHHQQVTVIKACSSHLHEHLTRPGLRNEPFGHAEVIQAKPIPDLKRSHGLDPHHPRTAIYGDMDLISRATPRNFCMALQCETEGIN
jgi:hypothetical protein